MSVEADRYRAFFRFGTSNQPEDVAERLHNRRACSALRGIGGWAPNKRSAGSKTIALLANANCFTSALLATMVSDKLGSGEQGIPSSSILNRDGKVGKMPLSLAHHIRLHHLSFFIYLSIPKYPLSNPCRVHHSIIVDFFTEP